MKIHTKKNDLWTILVLKTILINIKYMKFNVI